MEVKTPTQIRETEIKRKCDEVLKDQARMKKLTEVMQQTPKRCYPQAAGLLDWYRSLRWEETVVREMDKVKRIRRLLEAHDALQRIERTPELRVVCDLLDQMLQTSFATRQQQQQQHMGHPHQVMSHNQQPMQHLAQPMPMHPQAGPAGHSIPQQQQQQQHMMAQQQFRGPGQMMPHQPARPPAPRVNAGLPNQVIRPAVPVQPIQLQQRHMQPNQPGTQMQQSLPPMPQQTQQMAQQPPGVRVPPSVQGVPQVMPPMSGGVIDTAEVGSGTVGAAPSMMNHSMRPPPTNAAIVEGFATPQSSARPPAQPNTNDTTDEWDKKFEDMVESADRGVATEVRIVREYSEPNAEELIALKQVMRSKMGELARKQNRELTRESVDLMVQALEDRMKSILERLVAIARVRADRQRTKCKVTSNINHALKSVQSRNAWEQERRRKQEEEREEQRKDKERRESTAKEGKAKDKEEALDPFEEAIRKKRERRREMEKKARADENARNRSKQAQQKREMERTNEAINHAFSERRARRANPPQLHGPGTGSLDPRQMAGMGSQKRSYDQMLESSQAAEATMRDANHELGSASGTEPEGNAPMEEDDEYASVRHSFPLPPFGFLKPRRLGRGVLPELKKPTGISHKDLLTFLEREHQSKKSKYLFESYLSFGQQRRSAAQ